MTQQQVKVKQILKEEIDFKEYFVDDSTVVGLELEAENVHPRLASSGFQYWMVINDGSLRNNGKEFITHNHNPIQGYGHLVYGKHLMRAVDELWDRLQKYPNTELSSRCSLHVHVDWRGLFGGKEGYEKVNRFLKLYLFLEKVIFRYVGLHRMDSNFCVPLTKNGKFVMRYRGILTDAFIKENHTKYDALNLESLRKKGSLEFRMHPGTFEKSKIIEWVNILLCMRKVALDKTWPLDVDYFDNFRNDPYPHMFTIFGNIANSFDLNSLQEDIDWGMKFIRDTLVLNELASLPIRNLYTKGLPKLVQKFAEKNGLSLPSAAPKGNNIGVNSSVIPTNPFASTATTTASTWTQTIALATASLDSIQPIQTGNSIELDLDLSA